MQDHQIRGTASPNGSDSDAIVQNRIPYYHSEAFLSDPSASHAIEDSRPISPAKPIDRGDHTSPQPPKRQTEAKGHQSGQDILLKSGAKSSNIDAKAGNLAKSEPTDKLPKANKHPLEKLDSTTSNVKPTAGKPSADRKKTVQTDKPAQATVQSSKPALKKPLKSPATHKSQAGKKATVLVPKRDQPEAASSRHTKIQSDSKHKPVQLGKGQGSDLQEQKGDTKAGPQTSKADKVKVSKDNGRTWENRLWRAFKSHEKTLTRSVLQVSPRFWACTQMSLLAP